MTANVTNQEPLTQRATILERVRQRIDAKFGPQGAEPFFRGVERLPYRVQRVWPWCTVGDAGGERQGEEDGESDGRKLNVRVILHVSENWERADVHVDWSDYVERLLGWLTNWTPIDTGALRMKYETDTPADAVVLSGAHEAIWIIDFVCDYFTETERADDWNEQ